jgi:hypothetical protein
MRLKTKTPNSESFREQALTVQRPTPNADDQNEATYLMAAASAFFSAVALASAWLYSARSTT